MHRLRLRVCLPLQQVFFDSLLGFARNVEALRSVMARHRLSLLLLFFYIAFGHLCLRMCRCVSSTIPTLQQSSIPIQITLWNRCTWWVVTLWTSRRGCFSFNRFISTKWSFKLFSRTAERVRSFIYRKTPIVRVYIGVSTSPILSIDNGMCSHIVLIVNFSSAEAVEGTWWLRYISGSRF